MDESMQGTLSLLVATKDGDRLARDELFRRYYPRVSRIVALRLGKAKRELAEDLVQETLLAILRALPDFEPSSVAAFRSFLASVAENRIRDHARNEQAEKRGAGRVLPISDLGRTSLLEILFADERVENPVQAAGAHELEDRLERALLELDDRSRRAIDLRKFCEMSYVEIAAEMGMVESSARSLVARSLARLAEKLPGHGLEPRQAEGS